MIIRKIKMENFRGFGNKEIDFNDKVVVLLSAPNGIGKTTTIDAIEWCLTGDIKRLKTAFATRSTNDNDRKMNTDGILKNRDAETKAKIRVALWLLDGEKEIILCREQTKDELDPGLSKVTIDGDEEVAQDFVQEYIDDSFYNFHFCDVQKSFNVQNRKRRELSDFFGEFITNYDRQKQIADNLDIFAEDVDRYIEDKEKQKASKELIELYEKKIEKVKEEERQLSYPKALFYPNEKTEIVNLKKDELIAQKDAIKNCGYQIARERLHKLVEIEELRNQKLVIEKIISYWELKGDAIRRAVKVGFPENTEAITALEEKIGKLNAFTLSKDTVLQEGEAVIALGNGEYTILDFNEDRRKIQEKEQNVENVIKEIELLSKNNKMLKLLSSLIANKQEMIRYRNTVLEQNGNARCPVCGSKSFATMEETSILKEADEYVKQNGITVKKKEVEKSLLQKDIEVLYQKIISCLKDIVKNEKEKLTSKIGNLKVLKNETQSYFDEVKKIELIREEINFKELTEEKARELLAHIERELLEKPGEHEARNTYQQILTVLGYEFYNETVHQTYEKVKRRITKSYEISNFSYDLFVAKINCIDGILSNKELSDLKESKEKATKKNEVLDKEIAELQKLKETASQRSKNIKVIVEELSKDEYKKVGPALAKFYNKLARFNAGNGINILPQKEGISLVDNKGKNIVNVLSNGQISVFMLAHFFAGINSRNDREKFRVYFIDDLTACMDDVNMLAFMDLLKYQISTKSTMDQLFFSTCDDRISKLLKYKLDGRGIELCELSESDFV